MRGSDLAAAFNYRLTTGAGRAGARPVPGLAPAPAP
jgi:hypothetical protein